MFSLTVGQSTALVETFDRLGNYPNLPARISFLHERPANSLTKSYTQDESHSSHDFPHYPSQTSRSLLYDLPLWERLLSWDNYGRVELRPARSPSHER